MYKKLSPAEKQLKRGIFKLNPLYCTVYKPLWHQQGEDLSPEEVWIEANNHSYLLKQECSNEVEIRVRESFDDLCERYACFIDEANEIIRRSPQQAVHSAMMVSFVTFLLLLNVYPEAESHPFAAVCQALNDVMCNIDGYKKLYEETRNEEDRREAKGLFIETVDYIEQIYVQEENLSSQQLDVAHRLFGQFVKENLHCNLKTKLDNERMLSRVNDKNDHCLQQEVDLLRKQISEINEDQRELDSNNIPVKIVSFFNNRILNVEEPNLLYFLLLAMWARRLLESKEIPGFVRMVGEAYPDLFNEERTQEKVIMSLQNMNNKTTQYFDVFVKDQSSMVEYIDLMYPKKKNGSRRKDGERAVNLANKLFLELK